MRARDLAAPLPTAPLSTARLAAAVAVILDAVLDRVLAG